MTSSRFIRSVVHALAGYVRRSPFSAGKSMIVTRVLGPLVAAHPQRSSIKTTFGAKFVVDTVDEIQRHLFLFGIWEPNLTMFIERRLRPGDVFIDIGANIGYFTALASRLVGTEGIVVAVEPARPNYAALEQMVRRNHLTNVRAVEVAISDSAGEMEMFVERRTNLGNTSVMLPQRYDDHFVVRTDTWGNVLKPEELRRARIIKIDVEGMEAILINALGPFLHHLRPDAELVIEISPPRLAEQGIVATDAVRVLVDADFHVYRFANHARTWEYPRVMHGGHSHPHRWREPYEDMSDFVFSRANAEEL